MLAACVMSTTLAAQAAEGDKSAAELAIAEVDKAGVDGKPAEAQATLAKKALLRADAARASGDSAQAMLLEGLARTHAEMARDVLRAAKIEGERTTAEQRTTELSTDSERKRALIEEIAARKQRAAADLAAVEAAAAARPPKPEGKTDTKGEGKKVSSTGEVKEVPAPAAGKKPTGREKANTAAPAPGTKGNQK